MSEKITIGITAFREGKLLQRAIDGMLAQTVENWNGIIVVDGGHDDQTADIAKSVSDSRVKVLIQSENAGPYPTREVIFERSSNDIVLHCDGDDQLRPNAVKTVSDLFTNNPCKYAGFGAMHIFPDGSRNLIPGRKVTLKQYVLEGMFPGYPIMRKSLWESSGKYHRSLLRGRADFELILRFIRNKVPFSYTETVIIDKYEQPSSVQTSYREKLGEINKIIVDSNMHVFAEYPEVKRLFLARGYYEAAWEAFASRDIEAARKWANDYAQLMSSRAVWPLDSKMLPDWLVLTLGKTRRRARNWRRSRLGFS